MLLDLPLQLLLVFEHRRQQTAAMLLVPLCHYVMQANMTRHTFLDNRKSVVTT